MSNDTNSCCHKRCVFCDESISNKSAPIPIMFGASSPADRETSSKLKPLRSHSLTSTGSHTRLMCKGCAEKCQVSQESLSVWLQDLQKRQKVQKFHQRDEKSSRQQKLALRLECPELHDKGYQPQQSQNMPQKPQVSQLERRDGQSDLREHSTRPGRRQKSTQPSASQQEATHRSSLQQLAEIYRVSRESAMRHCSASPIHARTQTHRPSPIETPTCSRKPSNEQSERRNSEQKGQQSSSTAGIVGISGPSTYIDESSQSPTLCGSKEDPLDCRQREVTLPQTKIRKQTESEEERHQRRSASYTHKLLRMRRYYDKVQVNGSRSHPATAPPRRIHMERRAKSDMTLTDKNNIVEIDLDYLRAYKDAR